MITDLFKKNVATAPQQGATTSQSQNNYSLKPQETYTHLGKRICAMVDGSSLTLKAYLQKIYIEMYQKQANNAALQAAQRQKIQTQINQKRNNIAFLNKQLNGSKQREQDLKDEISKLDNDERELKSKVYEVNKEAKIKLILGLVILLPLTLYLFLFYSSTFYSAFFKDFGANANVLNSMFDAEALKKALEASVTELAFVLCAPIIFMGLGFILHFFAIQKSWTKYVKMGAILVITFVFDAILAYMIGKHLHEMAVIIGTASLDSKYGFSEAVSDINTWAVIFCGFIVYIIWGAVFDMTMSAYSQLDLNREMSKQIEAKKKKLKADIRSKQQEQDKLNNQIKDENNAIAQLTKNLGKTVIIQKPSIKLEMTNFFTGWTTQMNVLGMSQADQDKANDIFEKTVKTLLN
ncbi:MAG: hypothetical protein IJ698_06025 [Prevotella sp.]|nr:hypothetical protein [Prevotella sp.]